MPHTDCGFVYHRRCQKRADCENGATDLSSVSDLSPVAAVNCENETDSSPAAANSECADDLSSADVEGDRKVTAVQTTDDESSSNSVPTTCRPLVTLGDAIILTTFGKKKKITYRVRDKQKGDQYVPLSCGKLRLISYALYLRFYKCSI